MSRLTIHRQRKLTEIMFFFFSLNQFATDFIKTKFVLGNDDVRYFCLISFLNKILLMKIGMKLGRMTLLLFLSFSFLSREVGESKK
jgi:hypothetical protein